MVDFVESPRFPDNISYGSSGGPGFKTFIFEGHTGIEQRLINWSRARGRWDVSYGVRDKTDMDELRAFFYQMRGRAVGFRFKDWGDYNITNELIGTGDGVENTFLVTKAYGATNTYSRRIFKLVDGTVSVTVNGVSVPLGGGISQVAVSLNTGTLVFGSSVVPPSTHPIRVTAEFDVPARFDIDQMSAAHDGFLTESWGSIPIVELLLEEA